MKVTRLESLILKKFLASEEVQPHKRELHPESINVISREMTGVGFLTEFERSSELKLFNDGVSIRWGRVGARLNVSKIETGYLVYVDDGHVSAIEGYTYGDEWPDQVSEIEIYTLTIGNELEYPPK